MELHVPTATNTWNSLRKCLVSWRENTFTKYPTTRRFWRNRPLLHANSLSNCVILLTIYKLTRKMARFWSAVSPRARAASGFSLSSYHFLRINMENSLYYVGIEHFVPKAYSVFFTTFSVFSTMGHILFQVLERKSWIASSLRTPAK